MAYRLQNNRSSPGAGGKPFVAMMQTADLPDGHDFRSSPHSSSALVGSIPAGQSSIFHGCHCPDRFVSGEYRSNRGPLRNLLEEKPGPRLEANEALPQMHPSPMLFAFHVGPKTGVAASF